jgi:hypothetical protein
LGNSPGAILTEQFIPALRRLLILRCAGVCYVQYTVEGAREQKFTGFRKDGSAMSVREIGCCGAYCKTCRASTSGSICRGCKLGYENKERDINKARCKIKVCCFRDRRFETCADCPDYPSCRIIQDFYNKKGYKYKRYKQSVEFIRENGYARFIEIASNWKGAYGRLD